MSKLIVEVCEVIAIKNHPNADRLKIAQIKGWNVIVPCDSTGKTEFSLGDKCIYIPYDAVLPPTLANGPEDDPPGRLNVARYCAPLSKNQEGERPPGSRVRAVRLRGERSFGIIFPLNPSLGDDLYWPVGTDVSEHFGITKWDPIEECEEADVELPHPRFHSYTDIQPYANFPTAILDKEDVVFTEKIHGKNCRLGLILVPNEKGNAVWNWAVGSMDIRRKERFELRRRVRLEPLVEQDIVSADAKAGQVYFRGQRYWLIEEVRLPDPDAEDPKTWLKVLRVKEDEITPDLARSEFWDYLNDNIKAMLVTLRDREEWQEPVNGIIVFGEIYGHGVQDMEYGLVGEQKFRVFDIAVNGQYLGHKKKVGLLSEFNIPQVPILYRGPFTVAKLEQFTDGPTTLCDPNEAGRFQGKEGVVITPTEERFSEVLNGRVIMKSVSVDYLGRRGSTDNR